MTQRLELERVWGDEVGLSVDAGASGRFVVGGELLVSVKPGASPDAVAARAGGRVRSSIPAIGVHVVRFPEVGTVAERQARLRVLRADPSVAWVDENGIGGQGGLVPNDPMIGDGPSKQWHLGAIGAPDAWDVTPGAQSVKVAVVDTGWESANPEFAGPSGVSLK